MNRAGNAVVRLATYGGTSVSHGRRAKMQPADVFGGGAPYIENVLGSDANGELGSKVTKEIDAFFYAKSPFGPQTGAPQFWRMRPQKNLVSP